MLALANRRLLIVAMLSGIAGLVVGAAIAKVSHPPIDVVFANSKTVIGQSIEYPRGVPKVTAAIVTMQPGQTTGWHRHDAPLFAYILAGELTVDYGPDGTRTFRKGDAVLDAFKTYHNGRSSGDEATRLLAVFMGAEGMTNTEMRP